MLSHSDYTQSLYYPTLDFGDFPISAYRLSSRRSTPPSLEGSHSSTYLYSDCPLTKYSSKRIPKQWHLPWRTGILVLNLSLFLATTTSVQLVEALRQLHFPKTMIQTIELAMKYTYILGKTPTATNRMRAVANHWPKGESRVIWIDSWTLVFIIENHTKEVYEAMTLRGYGMDVKTKTPFRWKKEDVLLLLELIVLVAATTMLR